MSIEQSIKNNVWFQGIQHYADCIFEADIQLRANISDQTTKKRKRTRRRRRKKTQNLYKNQKPLCMQLWCLVRTTRIPQVVYSLHYEIVQPI